MTSPQMTCADYSRHIEEPLIGTASTESTFFLLEYHGVFGADAITESAIPQSVKDHLNAIPNGRILLIRHPNSPATPIHFFVVSPAKNRIYALELANYEAILSLNLADIVAGNSDLSPYPHTLTLVCTNGKRDVCCSSYGMPVYNALHALDPNTVWQSSHVGGHRFAGTALVFPYGISYGYLTPEDAPTLHEYTQSGRVWLDRLRGRTIFASPVQVAEYHLRRRKNLETLGAVEWVETVVDGEQTIVTLTVHGNAYQVILTQQEPLEILQNTTDTTLKSVRPFRLVAVKS